MSDDKKYGSIKFFNDRKGYGFIIPADPGEDVFFHVRNVKNGKNNPPQKDDKVSYTVLDGKRGKEANDVVIVG